MRVFIVEDERPAMERLEGFLNAIEGIEIIGTAGTGEEAAAAIDEAAPDLLLLDIHLPDISGIDLLRLIEPGPMVIFATAYDQYALQAFELQAIDYILKPFSEERLQEAIEKARRRLDQDEGAEPAMERLRALLSEWRPGQHFLKRIPSRVAEKIHILSEDEIVYFATDNKLVFAHLVNNRFLINYTLEELEARLDPEKFFRIHRSTIVNLNFVRTIEPWFAGGYKTVVKDRAGSELVISRQAGKRLRSKLGW